MTKVTAITALDRPLGRSILIGLAAAGSLLTVTAQGASASSVTFEARTGTCRGGSPGTTSAVVCPNPPNTNQTRPIQLAGNGNPIPAGRDFIYDGLSPNSISGLFTGVTGWQWGPASPSPTPNTARFGYSGGTSTGSGTNLVNYSGIDLDFRPFYLTGSCALCGSANSVVRTKLLGSATRTSFPGGTSNVLTSSTVPIVYGASGATGTLNFNAFTTVISGAQTSDGSIFLTAPDTLPPVPGPLPLLGAGTAFAFSRRLRKRIKSKVQPG